MALTKQLSALRVEARERADMVNSGFVQDPELNSFINASLKELYDLLVASYQDYFLKFADTQFVVNQDTYTLPTDFYKSRGIDLLLGGVPEDFIRLKPFNFAERSRTDNIVPASRNIISRQVYIIQAGNVRFIPNPASNDSFRIWYIPHATPLVADGDTFDGINGWEDYIVVDAAIKMLQKEESDVQVLFAQKQLLKIRIENMAEDRDAGEPKTISDSERGQNRHGGHSGF